MRGVAVHGARRCGGGTIYEPRQQNTGAPWPVTPRYDRSCAAAPGIIRTWLRERGILLAGRSSSLGATQESAKQLPLNSFAEEPR